MQWNPAVLWFELRFTNSCPALPQEHRNRYLVQRSSVQKKRRYRSFRERRCLCTDGCPISILLLGALESGCLNSKRQPVYFWIRISSKARDGKESFFTWRSNVHHTVTGRCRKFNEIRVLLSWNLISIAILQWLSLTTTILTPTQQF